VLICSMQVAPDAVTIHMTPTLRAAAHRQRKSAENQQPKRC
jgi:hypothetical protein